MARRSPLLLSIFGSAFAVSCGGKSSAPSPDAATLTGSAKITWNIVSPSGAAVTCAQLGIQKTSVSLGGTPVVVDCGQEQVATFDGLIPDRYPVIIELLKLDTAVFQCIKDNIVVTASQEVSKNETFTADPLAGTLGAMTLRWTIDGEAPATACTRAGASTVNIQDLPGSKDHIQSSAACNTSSVTISKLQPGDYALLFVLSDSTGQRIATTSLDRVTVAAGMTATPNPAAFFTTQVQGADLYAQWTVDTATSVRAGCQRAGADGLVIKAIPVMGDPVATFSASVACSAGQLRQKNVPPGTSAQRIVFQLYKDFFSMPPLPVLLTSTSAEPFFFIRGKTTSVAVTLKTM